MARKVSHANRQFSRIKKRSVDNKSLPQEESDKLLEKYRDLIQEYETKKLSKFRYALIPSRPAELAAVMASLDECQEYFSSLPSILYRIGEVPSVNSNENHKVVIGYTGNTAGSAVAITATSLIKDFPTLRCVILV